MSDIWHAFSSNIYTMFRQSWTESVRLKSQPFDSMFSSFPKKPWFYLICHCDRRFITTFIRLRSGHCLTKAFLNRMGMVDSPSCDCGSIQTIEHLLT
ncbi:hypothetical protein ABEB36_009444 [Hypothenemus hampei]|uniref:Uncharacterized protein n=1 Tax=Hypothenemus hampei TaxID=57062 RepID=A0ABD1EJA5_HYPHA